MAEELHSNQHHEDAGFEREDMGARNVYAFLIALALMGVLVHFVVKGIYGFMDSYEKAHQPPANPLGTRKRYSDQVPVTTVGGERAARDQRFPHAGRTDFEQLWLGGSAERSGAYPD